MNFYRNLNTETTLIITGGILPNEFTAEDLERHTENIFKASIKNMDSDIKTLVKFERIHSWTLSEMITFENIHTEIYVQNFNRAVECVRKLLEIYTSYDMEALDAWKTTSKQVAKFSNYEQAMTYIEHLFDVLKITVLGIFNESR